MKHSLLLASAALLSLAACQQQPTTKAAVAAPAPAVAATVAQAAPAAKLEEVPKPQLASEMRAFFEKYDLGYLLELNANRDIPMNGFYGAERYRIEFVVAHVSQDSIQKNIYHLEGKNRFKGQITPFEGEINFRQVQHLPDLDISDGTKIGLYSVTGTFELREEPSARGAGIIQGNTTVDIGIGENGKPYLFSENLKSPSRGGLAIFEGTWTSNRTGQKKPIVWASDILTFGEEILGEFTLGERQRDFNPKYAKLGWDTYWENDEWWTEPGTVTVQAVATDSL